MSVIYEPSGKAREYCELAVNLYHGCDEWNSKKRKGGSKK